MPKSKQRLAVNLRRLYVDCRYGQLHVHSAFPSSGGFDEQWMERDDALSVFQVLKDADALDRVRLGDLDPSYLRFPESLERVDIAWELLAASEE